MKVAVVIIVGHNSNQLHIRFYQLLFPES